jgi:hypothetical protein
MRNLKLKQRRSRGYDTNAWNTMYIQKFDEQTSWKRSVWKIWYEKVTVKFSFRKTGHENDRLMKLTHDQSNDGQASSTSTHYRKPLKDYPPPPHNGHGCKSSIRPTSLGVSTARSSVPQDMGPGRLSPYQQHVAKSRPQHNVYSISFGY